MACSIPNNPRMWDCFGGKHRILNSTMMHICRAFHHNQKDLINEELTYVSYRISDIADVILAT